MRKIIRYENKEGIPKKPPSDVPKQSPIPILGTMTHRRRMLDKVHLATEQRILEAATKLAKERTVRGEDNSTYVSHQSWFALKIDDLVGRYIHVLWPFNDDGANKAKLEWCQGVVVAKVKKNPPRVNILWNAIPHIEGFEEIVESEVELLENKWRRKVRYAWRMDLDVELDENYFDEEDDVVSDKEDEMKNVRKLWSISY